MTTARQLLTGALKSIGVLDPVEAISPEDAADGLEVLNDIVDAWNNDRLYLFTTDEVVVSFSGMSATIGPGQVINTPRPVGIESAFYRIGGIDYPLTIAEKPRYDAIPLKTTATGFPDLLYYDSGASVGTVFLYPVAPAVTEYHITVLTQLTAFADLDTDYALPQGYRRTLRYSVAEEMAPLHGREPSATVLRLAQNGRRAIRRAQDSAPLMFLDSAIDGGNLGRFNVLSGRYGT